MQRFGLFDGDYELTFAPSLNLIVGDNGTGKPQLLKLLYSCTSVMHDVADDSELTKTNLQKKLASKIVGRGADSLSRLTNRQQGRAKALQPIMGVLGGKVDENAGRFYLHRDESTFEMPLIAEDLRKLAASTVWCSPACC